MNEIKYKEQALVTIKDHDNRRDAISDWCYGLGGEMAEVVDLFCDKMISGWQQGTLWTPEERMNLAKELGDVLWYTVALAAELEIEIPHTFEEYEIEVPMGSRKVISCIYECLQLAIEVGYIHENMKHHFAHNEDLKVELIQQGLMRIQQYLHILSVCQDFSISLVADLNVAKLQHRYLQKGVFDFNASADRHAQEQKFTDTIIYRQLFQKITGEEYVAAIEATPEDFKESLSEGNDVE